MMSSFPCLGSVQGHCGQGLMRAGGAQPVPAPPGSAAEPSEQISDPLWENASGNPR